MQSGSLVEHIGTGKWWCTKSNIPVRGPKTGEIGVVQSFDPDETERHIFLQEYGHKCDCGCDSSASMPARLFKEIQPPMDIEIESLIEQTV